MTMVFTTSEANASKGRIAAASTARVSGIIPAALITAKERFNSPEEELIYVLFTVGGIGEIIGKNTTVSGAGGGCKAERDVVSVMAAATITELVGDDLENPFLLPPLP